MYMKNLPADLVNKVLIDINQQYKKKIEELEEQLKKYDSHVSCLESELEEVVSLMMSHGAICCEQCDTWGMDGEEVKWCENQGEYLCEECR
jgi:hypothetical protein